MGYREDIERFTPQCEQEETDKRVILEAVRLFPDSILTRENLFFHITSSGFILNRTLDRMLMVYHKIYCSWAWTGGHADGDADLLAVALREAKEETGVVSARPLDTQLITLDVLPVWPHLKHGRFVPGHQHLNVTYALIADEGDPLRVKADENSGVRWFDTGEIPRLTASEPYMAAVYRKIVERAKSR